VVKIYRPKPSDFVEQHHSKKSLKLQRFLHPNVWGPEDSRTTEQKAADEIKEAEWQHDDDKANDDEEKREGALKNADGVAARCAHDSREEKETPPHDESSDSERESDDKYKKRKEREDV
jgi:IS5 family transposase